MAKNYKETTTQAAVLRTSTKTLSFWCNIKEAPLERFAELIEGNIRIALQDFSGGKGDKSEFVERFPELSLFYRLFSPLNSEMICIFPYLCPYAESAREIRGIFVALHINNWFSEPILI